MLLPSWLALTPTLLQVSTRRAYQQRKEPGPQQGQALGAEHPSLSQPGNLSSRTLRICPAAGNRHISNTLSTGGASPQAGAPPSLSLSLSLSLSFHPGPPGIAAGPRSPRGQSQTLPSTPTPRNRRQARHTAGLPFPGNSTGLQKEGDSSHGHDLRNPLCKEGAHPSHF